ncbi:MAG: hypothetical protein ACRDKH_05980 [Solirubrobacterales bacterium]
MSRPLEIAFEAIERSNSEKDGLTRRRLVAGSAATMGSMGLLGLTGNAEKAMAANDPQTILNVAATAEVLATIVNTVGGERLEALNRRAIKRGNEPDKITLRNVRAAAREELIHYEVLKGLGAQELTRTIWVPNDVFRSRKGLLRTLEAGDQIFINAYLIGTTAFGAAGLGNQARFTGEFMGAEAVHRALARQSLGKLGNDRAFMAYEFTAIEEAVTRLQAAGFGFGQAGSKKGKFYDFDRISRRTPNPRAVNTRSPA